MRPSVPSLVAGDFYLRRLRRGNQSNHDSLFLRCRPLKNGRRVRRQGEGVTGRRSAALAARDRLIPLNCVELRGIIFSILGKRQLNGPDRTATCNAPQGHTKPHKVGAQRHARYTGCLRSTDRPTAAPRPYVRRAGRDSS